MFFANDIGINIRFEDTYLLTKEGVMKPSDAKLQISAIATATGGKCMISYHPFDKTERKKQKFRLRCGDFHTAGLGRLRPGSRIRIILIERNGKRAITFAVPYKGA